MQTGGKGMRWEDCCKCIFFHYDKYTEEFDCYLEQLGTRSEYDVWKGRSGAYWNYDRRRFGAKEELEKACKDFPCDMRTSLRDAYFLRKPEEK
jgi:hypothetical protein